MKPEVMGWRILVKPEKVKEYSDGGIYLPDETRDTDQMATTKGLVLDVGPTAFGTDHDEVALKKGDTIHFARYSGSTLKLEEVDKEELRIINDEDVLIIERGKKNG